MKFAMKIHWRRNNSGARTYQKRVGKKTPGRPGRALLGIQKERRDPTGAGWLDGTACLACSPQSDSSYRSGALLEETDFPGSRGNYNGRIHHTRYSATSRRGTSSYRGRALLTDLVDPGLNPSNIGSQSPPAFRILMGRSIAGRLGFKNKKGNGRVSPGGPSLY